jgi:hypothetical protein
VTGTVCNVGCFEDRVSVLYLIVMHFRHWCHGSLRRETHSKSRILIHFSSVLISFCPALISSDPIVYGSNRSIVIFVFAFVFYCVLRYFHFKNNIKCFSYTRLMLI